MRIEIFSHKKVGHSRVILDGVDISNSVQAVLVDARAVGVNKVMLTLIPDETVITGDAAVVIEQAKAETENASTANHGQD